MKTTGYHGTSANNARNIMRVGFKSGNSRGWLGLGAYFFEDDAILASQFSQYRHNTANVSIIRAKIDVADDHILDVRNPYSDGNKLFFQHRNHLIDAVGHDKLIVHTNKIQFDGFIFDDLCKKYNYELVRANTYTYNEFDRNYSWFSRVPNGTELCVKSMEIIIERDILPLEYIV